VLVEQIVDYMVERHQWIIGADDCIAAIERLQEISGDWWFARVEDWATRERMLHSYELFARYVMPHFQGSRRYQASNQWASERKDALQANRIAD
jgi:limonene 1,2-monooxygenase